MKTRPTRLRIDPYFLAGALAVLAAGGFYLYRAAPASPRPDVTHLSPAVTLSLDRLGVGYTLGGPGAPVHVVELFDYQCPACAAAHRATWPVLERHISTGTVRYTAYDLPLPSHTNAIPAALVAGCVAEQGRDGFWALRHRLFAEQAAWQNAYPAEPPLLGLAAAAGQDTAAVRECLTASATARVANLRQSWQVASAAGFTFTPAWAVNGRIVPWASLEHEIEQALEGSIH